MSRRDPEEAHEDRPHVAEERRQRGPGAVRGRGDPAAEQPEGDARRDDGRGERGGDGTAEAVTGDRCKRDDGQPDDERQDVEHRDGVEPLVAEERSERDRYCERGHEACERKCDCPGRLDLEDPPERRR